MGIRKHGVGEIIPEQGEDLTKQASKDWTENDEKELLDEEQE